MKVTPKDVENLNELIRQCYNEYNGICEHMSKCLNELKSTGKLYKEFKGRDELSDIVDRIILESAIKAEHLLAKIQVFNKVICLGDIKKPDDDKKDKDKTEETPVSPTDGPLPIDPPDPLFDTK